MEVSICYILREFRNDPWAEHLQQMNTSSFVIQVFGMMMDRTCEDPCDCTIEQLYNKIDQNEVLIEEIELGIDHLFTAEDEIAEELLLDAAEIEFFLARIASRRSG